MKDFICGNCGAGIDVVEDFCANCGARVVFDSDVRYCPRCGRRIAGNISVCANCGADCSNKNEYPAENTNIYRYNETQAGKKPEIYPGRPMGQPVEQPIKQQTGMYTVRPQDYPIEQLPIERAAEFPMEQPTERYNTTRTGTGNKKSGSTTGKSKGFKAKFAALPLSTKVAIFGAITIICILIIVGIVSLVNNALNATTPETVLPPPPTEEPTASPVLTVQAVSLTHDGITLTEKDILTGESITLHVDIEPEGIDEEIVWTNRNPEIVEITYENQKKSIVKVTGLEQGTARLSVKAGNIETVCIIRVEAEEQPPLQAETVFLTHNGTVVDKVELLVGENLDMRIVIEPDGVEEEIVITATTQGIVDIKTNSTDGTEITVTGKAEGTTTLSIVAGNAWYECVFEVFDERWRDAYAEFLRNPANYQKDISDWDSIRETFYEDHSARFTLRDMDNDEMYELLMIFEAQVGFAQSFILVYTYRQDVIVFTGRFDGAAAWANFFTTSNNSYPGVFSYGGRMGHFNVNYAEIRNGRLVITDVAYEEDHSDWGEPVQRTTVYNENLYREFQNERTVLIEAFDITAANISLILER